MKRFYQNFLVAARPAAFLGPRYCANSRKNPVNVEQFTLDEDIVRRHREIGERWQKLGEELSQLKAMQRFEDIIAATERGLALFAEVGAEDSPVQAEPMLLLEGAQASLNMQQYDKALELAKRAKKALTRDSRPDAGKVAETDEFIGFVMLRQGRHEQAVAIFEEVLQWIDVGSRTAPPMVTVAAKNMRRTTVMGLGLSLEARAAAAVASEQGDARAIYAAALERLIESLDNHIEEKDVIAVKDTLMGALRCFIGLGDKAQAKETCEKYISWCRRHGDEVGAKAGEERLSELKQG